MKLSHILNEVRMPDPGDYRAGDEQNARSPYYSGDDETYQDPAEMSQGEMTQFAAKYGEVFDSNSGKNADGTFWYTGSFASQQGAQAMYSRLQAGANEIAKPKFTTHDLGDEGTVYDLSTSYSFGPPEAAEPDYEDMAASGMRRLPRNYR